MGQARHKQQRLKVCRVGDAHSSPLALFTEEGALLANQARCEIKSYPGELPTVVVEMFLGDDVWI